MQAVVGEHRVLAAARARIAVRSTKATPCASHTALAAALKASSSRAIKALSRPDDLPKRVAPQSGIDSTSTRSARPCAKPTARSSSVANCARYSSSGRPRYWLLTPISRLTKSNPSGGRAASMPASSSSVVQPVVATTRGSASGIPSSRSRAASCIGQRWSASTPSPIV